MGGVSPHPFPCSVAQSCLTLCNPRDCSRPGSSVHGTSQAKIQERVAISFSRVSPPIRDQTFLSCTGRGFFTTKPQGSLSSHHQLSVSLSLPAARQVHWPQDCPDPGWGQVRAPSVPCVVAPQSKPAWASPSDGQSPRCLLITATSPLVPEIPARGNIQ